MYTHRLDVVRHQYVENGLFTSVIDVAQPWPIKLPIGQITPRHFLST